MKNLIFLIILISLLAGCTRKEEKKIENSKSSITSDTGQSKLSESPSNEASGLTNTNSADSISNILYSIKDVPPSAKYDGKIVASASWTDKNGFNILLVSETKEKKTRDTKMNGKYLEGEEAHSKELFGYHYLVKDNSSEQLWKIQDFVKDCDADLALDYIKNSLEITDINKNGIAESIFTYRLGCRSDVSPLGYKLLMHEGKDKYAIRGEQIINIKNTKPYGGSMNVDASFNKAPEGFLDFAKKHFKKFQKETFDSFD